MAQQVDPSQVASNLAKRMRWLLDKMNGDQDQGDSVGLARSNVDFFVSMWNTLEQGVADLEERQRNLTAQEEKAREVEEKQKTEASRLENLARELEDAKKSEAEEAERTRETESAKKLHDDLIQVVSQNATRVVNDIKTHVTEGMKKIETTNSTENNELGSNLSDVLEALKTSNEQFLTGLSQKFDSEMKSLKGSNEKSLADASQKIVGDVTTHVATNVDGLKGSIDSSINTSFTTISKDIDDIKQENNKSYDIQSKRIESLEGSMSSAANAFKALQNTSSGVLNDLSSEIVTVRHDTADIFNTLNRIDSLQHLNNASISEVSDKVDGVGNKVDGVGNKVDSVRNKVDSSSNKVEDIWAANATSLRGFSEKLDKIDQGNQKVMELELRMWELEENKRVLETSLTQANDSNKDNFKAVMELREKLKEKEGLISAESAKIKALELFAEKGKKLPNIVKEKDEIIAAHLANIKELELFAEKGKKLQDIVTQKDETIAAHSAKIKELEPFAEKGRDLEAVVKERDDALREVSKLQPLVSENDGVLKRPAEDLREPSEKKDNTVSDRNQVVDDQARKRQRTMAEAIEAESRDPSDVDCLIMNPRIWRESVDKIAFMLRQIRPVLLKNNDITFDDATRALVWVAQEEERWDNIDNWMNYGPQNVWYCFKVIGKKGWRSGDGIIKEGRCPYHDSHKCIQIYNAGPNLPKDTILFQK